MIKRIVVKISDEKERREFMEKYYPGKWLDCDLSEKTSATLSYREGDTEELVSVTTEICVSKLSREGHESLELRIPKGLIIPPITLKDESELSIVVVKDNSFIGKYYDGKVIGLINRDRRRGYVLEGIEGEFIK